MIIFAEDKTFINSHAVRYYKIVGSSNGFVLRAYMTRGESVLVSSAATEKELVETMKNISDAINNGEAYYEINLVYME